jgi:serine phosphatase RsbU (regulator of sigma subunit)
LTALLRRSDARRVGLLTTTRLRSLNVATADVHASSSLAQLIESMVLGASAIAERPAVVVTTTNGSEARLHRPGAEGRIEHEVIPRAVADRLLADARLGVTMLATDDANLVAEPHVGVRVMGELGEPRGALLVPAEVEKAVEEVVPLLAQLSLAATLAWANMRALDVEHRIALYLQRSLLPDIRPRLAGLDLAVRYEAASSQAQVGGDFYEAFELGDGSLVVAIGDVVGHSLHAATVMGEIRHAIRCYALEGYGPEGVVARVERLLQRFHPTMYTSMIVGQIDAGTSTLRFANAGHLPVLVVGPHGARFVESTGSLVGLGEAPPEACTVTLEPGDMVVLVTDGLVERRGEHLDIGLERFRLAAASRHDLPDLDEFLDGLVADLTPAGAFDDIAALVVRMPPDR